MGDASSEENVLGQKCVLCEVKVSCCNYMGLPLCFDDRSAVRAWKRGRPVAEVSKAVDGIKTGSNVGLREEVKALRNVRSEAGSQAMKIAIAKSSRAAKCEAITANEDFHESASEDERGERELTQVQYQKYMKDLENMKGPESLRRFKELYKDQNDGESFSSGDENATVWAAEPRRRVVKTTRGHRETAGQRTRRSASVPERSRTPRGESMRASERSRGESVRLTERSPAPGSKSNSRRRRY